MKKRTLAFLLGLGMLIIFPIPTQATSLFTDDFDDGVYSDKWTDLQETNPPAPINGASLSETNGVLKLEGPHGYGAAFTQTLASFPKDNLDISFWMSNAWLIGPFGRTDGNFETLLSLVDQEGNEIRISNFVWTWGGYNTLARLGTYKKSTNEWSEIYRYPQGLIQGIDNPASYRLILQEDSLDLYVNDLNNPAFSASNFTNPLAGNVNIRFGVAGDGYGWPDWCPWDFCRSLLRGKLDNLVVNHSVPFSSFSAKVEAEIGTSTAENKLEAKGNFSLGGGNDGINPVNEAVKIKIGSFETTIPASSFKWFEHPKKPAKSEWKFKGTIDGVPVKMKIKPLDNNDFEFKFEAENLNLCWLKSGSLEIRLNIGDDFGKIEVTPEIEGLENWGSVCPGTETPQKIQTPGISPD